MKRSSIELIFTLIWLFIFIYNFFDRSPIGWEMQGFLYFLITFEFFGNFLEEKNKELEKEIKELKNENSRH